ncbi:MAG: hypothetical protein ACOYN4_10040 [Bacteroidales bacterium]
MEKTTLWQFIAATYRCLKLRNEARPAEHPLTLNQVLTYIARADARQQRIIAIALQKGGRL